MSLFSKSTDMIVSGSLKKVTFNTGERAENEPVIHVDGAKTGLMAWLLNAIGFSDNSFSFSVDPSFITIVEGKETLTFFPANEVHSVTVGYTTKKLYLVIAVMCGFFAILNMLLMLLAEGAELSYGTFVFLMLSALLNIWLYKKSARLEFSLRNIGPDRATRVLGVRLQSAVDGPNVSPEDLQRISDGLRAMTKHQSRHYKV